MLLQIEGPEPEIYLLPSLRRSSELLWSTRDK